MTREEALKWFKDHAIIDETKDGQAHEWAIKALSEQTGWIPCSERLPSESGNYLITVADLRLGHNGEYTVTMADFYAKAKKWNSAVDVYAWMPLPEPYKGGDDE